MLESITGIRRKNDHSCTFAISCKMPHKKIVIPVRLAPNLSDNVASVLFMRHGIGVVQLPVVLRRRLRAFVLDLYPQLFSHCR
jgi:hypothetical protein